MLPHGNREDFIHHDMEILFTEDVVEVVGRGRGRGWLHEDIPGRNLDGRGRFHFRGNGREGFASSREEGRRDIRLEMPPEPEPSRHLDWSSIASPPARTSPHSAHDVQSAQNQLNVPPTETTRSGKN